MKSRFIQETLNWASLEKISVFKMKTIATVLTQKGTSMKVAFIAVRRWSRVDSII